MHSPFIPRNGGMNFGITANTAEALPYGEKGIIFKINQATISNMFPDDQLELNSRVHRVTEEVRRSIIVTRNCDLENSRSIDRARNKVSRITANVEKITRRDASAEPSPKERSRRGRSDTAVCDTCMHHRSAVRRRRFVESEIERLVKCGLSNSIPAVASGEAIEFASQRSSCEPRDRMSRAGIAFLAIPLVRPRHRPDDTEGRSNEYAPQRGCGLHAHARDRLF
jgi:hypothetical protein